MAHGYRPVLPDVFPSDENEIIRIEGEKHRYEVFENEFGDPLPKFEYTLNKAPVATVEEVTGQLDGKTVEFSEGADYVLTPLVSERTDSFTFDETQNVYTLTTVPDADSTSIEDASGDTYVEDTDYAIVSVDGVENGIDWSIGGGTPDDGETFTVTYDVTFEDAVIDWEQGGDTPDAGTLFSVTYRAISLISRYIENSANELRTIEDELDEIIKSKFLDNATGDELDQIGRTFGQIGRRSGRDDTQYRIYLKSVVQSFVSRGTIAGIKAAISAATDVPLEDIQINEDFATNSYEVQIVAATPITVSLLEEVADIADPSGVDQTLTRFTLPEEEMQVDETIDITEGQQIPDEMSVDDATGVFNRANFEDIVLDDALAVNPNKFAVSETAFADDANAIDPNLTTVLDQMSGDDLAEVDPNTTTASDQASADDTTATPRGEANEDATADDTVASAQTIVAWDDGDWDNMNWADEHN